MRMLSRLRYWLFEERCPVGAAIGSPCSRPADVRYRSKADGEWRYICHPHLDELYSRGDRPWDWEGFESPQHRIDGEWRGL